MNALFAPIKGYLSNAEADGLLYMELEKHLTVLKRQGLILTWNQHQISPGIERDLAINTHLETASLILLLISDDFFSSEPCYNEMQRALQRYKEGSARVIPIIVRPCDWGKTPLGRLQALPENGKPITEWTDKDKAWDNVVAGIRRAIEDLSVLTPDAPQSSLPLERKISTLTYPSHATPPPPPAMSRDSFPYQIPQKNPYELPNPDVPFVPPPPPRWNAKVGLIIGTVALALVLILVSVGISVLSRPQAEQKVLGSPTPVPGYPTSIATSTAPPTAISTGETTPYPPYHGTLVLNDPLRDNSSSNFGEGDSDGFTCRFTQGAYHVSQTTGRAVTLCVAPATDFSNFIYEVQMTIIKGDSGGIFFRADWASTKLYFFSVDADGVYLLMVYTDNSHSKILKMNTFSDAINRGLNQTNLVAVIANGNTITLYVNHQQLVSINDNTYSHGKIGLVANPYINTQHPTEVAFNNAKVWTLA